MEEYRVLKFLDRFKGLFKKMKIDYPIMRKIIQVKLTLDSRRTSTVLTGTQGNKKKKEGNNFLRTIPVYLFIGLFMIPIMLLSDNYLISMGIVLGMFIFLMMTSLISDFSSVLLDVRDKGIILTKPVDNRTLNMAKILHIFMYVFMITMGISGPSLIVGLVKNGIMFFLLYLIILILIDLFVIMLTALIYLFILRFFSGEKLKDIINYVQIGLTISITIGYQILIRVFDFSEVFKLEINPTWWSYLLPPLWFAAPFELLLKGNMETYVIIYSILALIIPIVSIILYVIFIPSFESNLQKLNQADNKGKDKNKLTRIISKLVSKDKEERTFYRFATNMLRNERKLKLTIYPNLGFGLIFPFLMMISGGMRDMDAIRNSKTFLTIYFMGISIPTTIKILGYSESYKGAWIYKLFPVEYNKVHKATLKSMFINLITPAFLIVSIGFLFIFRLKVILDLTIAYLGMFLSVYLIFKANEKSLPFSRDFTIMSNKGGLVDLFISLVVYGGLVGFHFLAISINNGKYIYLIVLLLANMISWKYGFRKKEILEFN